jgi:2-polyprenyl-3-methyl-5-hydroxy-6-metoxy-1,4-benzoquinol methylase
LVRSLFQADPPSEIRYEYGAGFYRANAAIAVRSAERIVPKVIASFPVHSVVDFGCGRGAWLSVWAKAGSSVTGVDGPFVDQRRLLIDSDCFHNADLARPIDLGKRFDLVQSLEVAEHLRPLSRMAVECCSLQQFPAREESTTSMNSRLNTGGASLRNVGTLQLISFGH